MEWKLDGIRIQAHLSGGDVRLFTRTLDDITARLPEVVAVLARLPVTAAVLDGELIALREDGRPLPFQDTASRTASFEGSGPAVPLSVFLFDALHLDGADLIDAGDQQRHAALARAVPAEPAHAAPGHRLGRGGHRVLRQTRWRTATRASWSSR